MTFSGESFVVVFFSSSIPLNLFGTVLKIFFGNIILGSISCRGLWFCTGLCSLRHRLIFFFPIHFIKEHKSCFFLTYQTFATIVCIWTAMSIFYKRSMRKSKNHILHWRTKSKVTFGFCQGQWLWQQNDGRQFRVKCHSTHRGLNLGLLSERQIPCPYRSRHWGL